MISFLSAEVWNFFSWVHTVSLAARVVLASIFFKEPCDCDEHTLATESFISGVLCQRLMFYGFWRWRLNTLEMQDLFITQLFSKMKLKRHWCKHTIQKVRGWNSLLTYGQKSRVANARFLLGCLLKILKISCRVLDLTSPNKSHVCTLQSQLIFLY